LRTDRSSLADVADDRDVGNREVQEAVLEVFPIEHVSRTVEAQLPIEPHGFPSDLVIVDPVGTVLLDIRYARTVDAARPEALRVGRVHQRVVVQLVVDCALPARAVAGSIIVEYACVEAGILRCTVGSVFDEVPAGVIEARAMAEETVEAIQP